MAPSLLNQTMMNMLQTGPPIDLKRRILGDHGHLSNENAGRLLNYIYITIRWKHILLGHLSKENNLKNWLMRPFAWRLDQETILTGLAIFRLM